jgi:acetyltransferase-like isoleucine patch superfamily enzyme
VLEVVEDMQQVTSVSLQHTLVTDLSLRGSILFGMTQTPAMTPQQAALSDLKRSGLAAYRELAVGSAGWGSCIFNEVIQGAFGWIPGLAGFALRSLLYPLLFKRCGKRPAIGRGGLIRVPGQITLGSGILIDDYVALDVRGPQAAIDLGDRVSIGRFSTIAAKYGAITLSAGANIGSYCRVATNSRVFIGESVLVGAYCYIGPGNHTEGEGGEPLIAQPMDIRGGVEIGDHAWLGARVTVLDGVKIGRHAIIGAHSLVTKDVPDWGVAVGAPARVVKIRDSAQKDSTQKDSTQKDSTKIDITGAASLGSRT